MHRARFLALAILAAPALVVSACTGDASGDTVDLDGSAGASGTGGGGGSGADGGGTGGSAGKGASGGTAGSAGNAGSSGTTGAGGSGGKAGASGAGGTAGSGANAGSGGAAGMSVDSGADGISGMDASDARSEASSDTPTGDAGAACLMGPATGRTCTSYCNDWFSTCQPLAMWSATYASPAACLAACSTWADGKLCCRAEHVQNAVNANNMNQMNTHCGHAVGVDGPPACAN